MMMRPDAKKSCNRDLPPTTFIYVDKNSPFSWAHDNPYGFKMSLNGGDSGRTPAVEVLK